MLRALTNSDTMSRNIKVGITHGDFNGVGYEVILKALADERITELCTPVIFGSATLAGRCRKEMDIEEFNFISVPTAADAADGRINVVDICGGDVKLTPGRPSSESGESARLALEMACAALESGEIDVLVTAPICKENVHGEDFPFPGHTEFLEARIGNGNKSLMILFNDNLRVALVTTHLPVAKVASSLSTDKVAETIALLHASLRRDFAIDGPKIAVLSLNPHAGDGGLLGSEEAEIISPAIAACRDKGILAFGPIAADGLFGSGAWRNYDGIVAMYHDQGLAPFKAIAGAEGVNFTAGLPFVRTSPDHGTAFDIAWKGEANPDSMRQAIYEAIDIFRNRANFIRATRNPLRRQFMEKGPDKTVDLSKDEPAD